MNLTTANDNMPLGDNFPEGINLEHSARPPLILSTMSTTLRPILASTAGLASSVGQTSNAGRKPKHKKTGGRFPVYALLLLWLIMAATIARFAASENNNLLSGENLAIATSGFGLLSLWLASLARRRHAKISHSFAVAGACISVVGLAWFYFSPLANFAVSPELIVMGIAALSLVFAKLWRTPFLLHLSAFLMIGWSSYVFINVRISDYVWLFPALWSLQMFLAVEARIKRTIALSIFSGLFWIGVNLILLT